MTDERLTLTCAALRSSPDDSSGLSKLIGGVNIHRFLCGRFLITCDMMFGYLFKVYNNQRQNMCPIITLSFFPFRVGLEFSSI